MKDLIYIDPKARACYAKKIVDELSFYAMSQINEGQKEPNADEKL